MASRRSEIGLGDLVQTLVKLPTGDQAELDRMARCLRFEAGALAVATPDYRPTLRPRPSPEPLPSPATNPAMPSAPEPPIPLPDEILRIDIAKLPGTWDAESIPILPPEIACRAPLELDAPRPPPVPRWPLFPPRTARGLLGAAVMRPAADGDPDLARLIQAIILKRPVRILPRLPRPSARSGCQLLLDFSDALAPWWEDLRALIGQFHALLGEAACPVYEFTGDPRDALHWTEAAGEEAWRAVPNQPLVLVTDFGLIRIPGGEPRPSLAIWCRFAEHCRRKGVPVVAITPLRRERCPHALGQAMALVHWNPTTRAADIKRLIDRQGRYPA